MALPLGAAYAGATAIDLEEAKRIAGDDYYPSVYNPNTLSQKGGVTVAKRRVPPGPDGSQGFQLFYELHGKGPVKAVFVMGLNNSYAGWLPQVDHLSQDPNYSCLVFDNRGYGNSETPKGLYSTSEMAKDVLELLDHVGWTSERTVHLVGVSMGGMISLELAKQQPTRFASLTLISTAPGRRHRTPIQGVASLARVLGGRILGFDSDSYRLNRLMDTLFPQIWLEEKCERDPKGRTNRENIYELFAWRYKFNKRQNVHGAMAQIKAALTHHVSDEDLIRIDSSVPRIAILTGDEDHLVNPRNSEYLRIKLSKATYHHFENTGHAIGLQHTTRLNQLLIQVFEEGEQEVRKGGW